MYQREQILFTIMLTMIKDHVIKYHRKSSPLPALPPGSTVNDRPPRLHRTLWSPHNSPHYERLMRRPTILPGYDPSSEMGLRATPPLLYPPREREPAYLSCSFSSVNFAMLEACD
ncbi:hypothetical protein AVEN_130919-1 [Araneus ventricosus]|uniref:Uncharacterized protein n=1 Tax=Araneus ventricosus TaxID=182803 RepID=A0A4Y2FKA3_ARAVE|nr:hypothetical protein AVEN_130919-1 [Araneus ventricosus]